jgi:predicted DNA-binding WGR domain protein
MASAKRSQKVSRISRNPTVAYARRKKPSDGDDASDTDASDASDAPERSEAATAAPPSSAASTSTPPAVTPPAVASAKPDSTAKLDGAKLDDAKLDDGKPDRAAKLGGADAKLDDAKLDDGKPDSAAKLDGAKLDDAKLDDVKPDGAKPDSAAKPGSAAKPDSAAAAPDAPFAAMIEPPPGWPNATPVPSPSPVAAGRARTTTVAMPAQASIGSPPEMPKDAPPIAAPVNADGAENPTRMPGPREIPPGEPDDPAAPPRAVPAGDSRSMRRRADRYEFVLVYRLQTFVITRFGAVGTRGQWRVVEYPTSAAASHAYAKECSRFVSDGFSDYRE